MYANTKRYFPLVNYINCAVLVTLVDIIAGAASLYLVLAAHLEWAVLAVLVGVACDQVDGVIARKLSITSKFGGSLDVFGDFFLYVCFPAAFVVYVLGFSVAAFVLAGVLVAAGVMRLAYYVSEDKKDIVIGMPLSFFVLPVSLVYLYGYNEPNGLLAPVLLVATSALLWFSALSTQLNSILGRLAVANILFTFVVVVASLFVGLVG